MCCAELRTRSGELTGSSCRSGLMPYQSLLLTVMKTFFFSPLLLPGLKDERSSVNLELFSNFEDDQVYQEVGNLLVLFIYFILFYIFRIRL